MKRVWFLSWLLAAGLILVFPALAMADDDHRPEVDHTLFDGTNPGNWPSSGAVCGAFRTHHGVPKLSDEEFTWHLAVSNFSGGDALVRIIYEDGDFTHYHVPANSSFSQSQAGGGRGNRAFRIWVEQPAPGPNGSATGSASGSGELAGEASIRGKGVFCISCDADSAGDSACDAIIPN